MEEAVSGANENLLDLSPLFVVESLHKALLNIKYIPLEHTTDPPHCIKLSFNYREPPGSPLVMYKEQLVKWLHDKVDKMEVSIKTETENLVNCVGSFYVSFGLVNCIGGRGIILQRVLFCKLWNTIHGSPE